MYVLWVGASVGWGGWSERERVSDGGRAYVFLFRGETGDLNESSLTALIHSHTEGDHRDGSEALSGNRVRATYRLYTNTHTHARTHRHLHYVLQGTNLIFKTLAIPGCDNQFPLSLSLSPRSHSSYTYIHRNHKSSALTPSRFQVAIVMGALSPLSSYWTVLKALTSEKTNTKAKYMTVTIYDSSQVKLFHIRHCAP